MKNLLISNESLLTALAFAKTISEKIGGKIATMSDLAALRVAQDPDESIIWNRWFLSSTTIYFGTYQEKRLVVIADHFGPLNTNERFLEWKQSGEKDEGSTREMYGVRGCPKITQEEFNNLVEKKYGDVSLIDFDDYMTNHNSLYGGHITVSDALADPLLEKLLGRDRQSYEKFIEKCFSISKQNARQKGKDEGAAEKILELSVEDRYGVEIFMLYLKENKEFPTSPIALLLTMGTPSYYGNHDLSVSTEIHSMESLDYSQLIVLNDEKMSTVIVEYNPQKQWKKCLIANEEEFKEPFFSLRGDKELFVEYPKRTDGSYMDTGEIMFPLSEIKEIGGPTFFETDDCRFFLRYHIEEVRKVAPAEANAYRITDDVSPGDKVQVPVQFYKVTPITEKRIMRKKEVMNNLNLLLEINGVELLNVS